MQASDDERSASNRPTIRLNREPRLIDDGIPVFIEADKYTTNYDAIAGDHLASLDNDGQNPFMSETTWTAIDQSTLKILRDLVKPDDIILDAGVGLGRLLSYFPDHERHGVDVSLRYLARTKSSGIHVAAAKLEDLPYADDSFEVVVSTDVLEHVLDFYNATREIVRVLKPGGHLVVRVPFEEDMKAYYDYHDYEFVHVRRFDLWSLRLHFEKVLGLKYVEHRKVKPSYRGVTTARLRPMDDGAAVRAILGKLPQNIDGLLPLTLATYLEASEFTIFMNFVATHHPEVFQELTDQIGNHLEINIVFTKQ